jgi:hypothetical protein
MHTRQPDRQTDRQTAEQTDRQTDRQTDKQTDRQTDRQIQRPFHQELCPLCTSPCKYVLPLAATRIDAVRPTHLAVKTGCPREVRRRKQNHLCPCDTQLYHPSPTETLDCTRVAPTRSRTHRSEQSLVPCSRSAPAPPCMNRWRAKDQTLFCFLSFVFSTLQGKQQ